MLDKTNVVYYNSTYTAKVRTETWLSTGVSMKSKRNGWVNY